MSYSLVGFSAGILQNVLSGEPAIHYLDFGATGFIIAHEISHIVNQIVSYRVKSELNLDCLISFW